MTQLLTVPETAARLGVGRTYVYNLIAHGELPSVDLGHGKSKVRVAEAALEEWIKRRTRRQSQRQ